MNRALRFGYCVVAAPLFEVSRRSDAKSLARAHRARCGNLDLRCDRELAGASRALFERIVDALDLIQEVDERRFNWIWERMPRFYVAKDLPAQYWSLHHTCVLDAAKLGSRNRADTAATIVHEATHARFFAAGLKSWPDIRLRMERICVGEEMRFFRRLQRAGWRGVEARLDWYERLLERLRG